MKKLIVSNDGSVGVWGDSRGLNLVNRRQPGTDRSNDRMSMRHDKEFVDALLFACVVVNETHLGDLARVIERRRSTLGADDTSISDKDCLRALLPLIHVNHIKPPAVRVPTAKGTAFEKLLTRCVCVPPNRRVLIEIRPRFSSFRARTSAHSQSG
jgi:hypothetical protein